MGWLYKTFIRPVLFTRGSEEIHNQTLAALAWMSRSDLGCELAASFCQAPELPMELWGLRFPNPVGLAAGMDKHAVAAPIWPSFGFGFSELGGVTRHGQSGNPTPRMFRIPPDEALINRMGFNNPGAEALAKTLQTWRDLRRWPVHPVGINLGKSKVTPLEEAADDYSFSFRTLWPLADFFVVNVSSPNTPNLRRLQDADSLREILMRLQSDNQACALAAGQQMGTDRRAIKSKPVLVKIAPDLTFGALDDILQLAEPCGLAGIVATNTTLARPENADSEWQKIYAESGGLSGRPLRARSTEIIRHLHRSTRGRLPIIGVGGIFSAKDAWEKITAGASLVQIYSGMVYEGPTLAREIVVGLQQRLADAGLNSLQQAVGIES